MASSGSVFSETLQTITNTKLEELSKQRIAFEKQYEKLLATVHAEHDPLRRLILLVDGTKTCLSVKTAVRKNQEDGRLGRVIPGGTPNKRLETDLKNLDRFLEQARYDPSVSPKVLQDWEKSLLQYLSIQSSKYQYADLYAKLVTEWLSSEKTFSTDTDVEMGDSFEEIPNAKKLEARTEWEKVVFEPAVVDVSDLKEFLQKLFITQTKGVTNSIKKLRQKVEQFEQSLFGSSQFNVSTLRWVIQGLQSSDLLNNEKREVLKDFLTNTVILAEIADVLNMRMSSLSKGHFHCWGDYVPLEQRRKLNGSYSIHMHEDLLQAIFLHYVGVRWSVFFKKAFKAFRNEAWKASCVGIPKIDRRRREYYIGTDKTNTYPNLENERSRTHRRRYFAHQLLDHEAQQVQVQEGEEEAEFDEFVDHSMSKKRARYDPPPPTMPAPQGPQTYLAGSSSNQRMAPTQAAQYAYAGGRAKQTARKAITHVQPAHAYDEEEEEGEEEDDDDDDDDEVDFDRHEDDDDDGQDKNPIQAKQDLLHILSTEIILNKRLYGQLNCFHSVFESWNPLLPHASILTVLEFFGVSERWLSFFKTFLEAPLKFMDDGSADPRRRRRGTPGSHNLSDVFGEIIFACLDFSVNQATDGGLLHRLYDDIWFWNRDYEKCAKAWAAVLQFTKVMGCQLSESKTGSVRISSDDIDLDIDDRLPPGQIRWGFLYLDPFTGRFEIDQKMVDSHVEELRKQLQGKSKSVIDWIQVWNSYAATFFSSNFGKAANCFGREHVDKMLATHRHIQEIIFEGGNVVHFLKKTIEERFSVADIPDGFLFFPAELGGLDLKSPFVHLLQIRESVLENPYYFLDEFEEAERDDYAEAKRKFDKGDTRTSRFGNSATKWKPEEGADEFFSFEDFIRYREVLAGFDKAQIVKVYSDLLRKPKEESIDISVQVKQAVDQLQGQSNLRGITGNWAGMEAYWKWVTQMYGPEMVDRFGGLNIVDPGLLPIGMVSMFRQKRIKWQG